MIRHMLHNQVELMHTKVQINNKAKWTSYKQDNRLPAFSRITRVHQSSLVPNVSNRAGNGSI